MTILGWFRAARAFASCANRARGFALGKLWRKNLQGDLAAELCVLRQINVAHATRANLLQDLVVGETFADHGAFSGYWRAILLAAGSAIKQPVACEHAVANFKNYSRKRFRGNASQLPLWERPSCMGT